MPKRQRNVTDRKLFPIPRSVCFSGLSRFFVIVTVFDVLVEIAADGIRRADSLPYGFRNIVIIVRDAGIAECYGQYFVPAVIPDLCRQRRRDLLPFKTI